MFAWGGVSAGHRAAVPAPGSSRLRDAHPGSPTWGGGGSGGAGGSTGRAPQPPPSLRRSAPWADRARGAPPRVVGGGAGKRRGRGWRMCVSRGQPGNGRTGEGGGGGSGDSSAVEGLWAGGGAERSCAMGMERGGILTAPRRPRNAALGCRGPPPPPRGRGRGGGGAGVV